MTYKVGGMINLAALNSKNIPRLGVTNVP